MIRSSHNKPAPDSLDERIEQACASDPLPAYAEEPEPEPEPGPPLTKTQLRAARSDLSEWQTPEAFAKATMALCERCDSEEWFNRPHLKFLHDAYVLAEFAELMAVDCVRLAAPSEQWPDGYLKIDGKTRSIEVTSTHGGRKLGKEYRDVKRPTLDPVNNWVARAETIPRYLDEAISAKSKKNYSSPCWLLVYLNIDEYGIRQNETELAIATIKERYVQSFEAISVLWKGKSY